MKKYTVKMGLHVVGTKLCKPGDTVETDTVLNPAHFDLVLEPAKADTSKAEAKAATKAQAEADLKAKEEADAKAKLEGGGAPAGAPDAPKKKPGPKAKDKAPVAPVTPAVPPATV